MDELIFAGNKYISSKRASKLTGYTTDYIGQMCRGDKMDCRLVGRNWYINEEAVTKQKKSFKKEQFTENKKAIEYSNLTLEPMYYSDDNRSNNVEISKTLIADDDEELEIIEGEEVVAEESTEVEEEVLVPVARVAESRAIDLRNTNQGIIVRPKVQVTKRAQMAPQRMQPRFPMVRTLTAVFVLAVFLFVIGTFTLQKSLHYTSTDKTNIQTKFQLASIVSLAHFQIDLNKSRLNKILNIFNNN